MAVGLLSAGIGTVPPAQTYLDIGQGARLDQSLYDEPLPPLSSTRAQAVRHRSPAAALAAGPRARRRRAGRSRPGPARDDARGEAARRRRSISRRSRRRDRRRRKGGDPRGASMRGSAACARVGVVTAEPASPARARRRACDGDDLLIAIERPPPAGDRRSRSASPGEGFDGHADLGLDPDARASCSSTDIAPTILERLGIAVPAEMSGEPIEATGEVDPGRRAARGPPGGDRPAPGPGDRHQPADLGRAGAARRDRLSGAAACARRCPCSRSRSPTCRRCCC